MVAANTAIVKQSGSDTVVAAADSTTDANIADAGAHFVTVVRSETEIRPVDPKLAGDFLLVTVDIDTTGRRLIDEIVQLAAYSPKESYSQYIMPYMNLNPAARQRHQVRVISIGFYRMLKSMQTYKILKSKTEIAALKDFLNWLEALKAKEPNALGIILMYHEERKFIPYMILEALKKYSLLDRFTATVKSFVNGHSVAQYFNPTYARYSLRKLARELNISKSFSFQGDQSNDSRSHIGRGSSNFELFEGNAAVRAKFAYDVAMRLCSNGVKEDNADRMVSVYTHDTIKSYANDIADDLQELTIEQENLEKQNSFRPVFLNYFKTTLYHRVRAVRFRIQLSNHGEDLQSLNAVWMEKGREGVYEVLCKISTIKAEDKIELTDLLDSYYDPQKQILKPIIGDGTKPRTRRSSRNTNTASEHSLRRFNRRGSVATKTDAEIAKIAEQGAGGDKSALPDMDPDATLKPSPVANNSVANGGANGGGTAAGEKGNAATGRPQRNHRRSNRYRSSSAKPKAENEAGDLPLAAPKAAVAMPIAASN